MVTEGSLGGLAQSGRPSLLRPVSQRPHQQISREVREWLMTELAMPLRPQLPSWHFGQSLQPGADGRQVS